MRKVILGATGTVAFVEGVQMFVLGISGLVLLLVIGSLSNPRDAVAQGGAAAQDVSWYPDCRASWSSLLSRF